MAKKKAAKKKTVKKKAAKPPAKRSTPDRPTIRQTINWLIEGNNEDDILEAIADKFPAIAAGELLTAAVDHLASVGQADGTIIRGFVAEASREVYRRAIELGDYPTALRALSQLAKLT